MTKKKATIRQRARRPVPPSTLEQTLLQLIQNQALHQGRFAHIEALLAEHTATLAEHTAILKHVLATLQALPDAVRDKIGFARDEDQQRDYRRNN